MLTGHSDALRGDEARTFLRMQCVCRCTSELEDQKVSRIFLPSAGFLKGRAGSDLSGGLSSFTKPTHSGREAGLSHRQLLEGAILLFVQPRPDNPGLFCSADAEMEAFFFSHLVMIMFSQLEVPGWRPSNYGSQQS